ARALAHQDAPSPGTGRSPRAWAQAPPAVAGTGAFSRGASQHRASGRGDAIAMRRSTSPATGGTRAARGGAPGEAPPSVLSLIFDQPPPAIHGDEWSMRSWQSARDGRTWRRGFPRSHGPTDHG